MLKRRLTAAVLAMISLVAASQAAEVPRKAKEVTVYLTDGSKVMLSQYKGKVVAVIFILTGCSHCQMTTGFLIKAQQDYGPRGFQVLAAAIEQDSAAKVPGFIKQFGPQFPVGTTDALAALDWMQHPVSQIPHMPLLAFVDRQGNIRAQFEGDNEQFFNDQQEQNLRTQIEMLLKEGAPKARPTASTAPKK
ncbi:MAG TPA: TlpA disulfide reductase family protein [Bryobacteraceae bacterium]|nr:TlpA disulfide reductase family protein [Bryobacteraceae bacterium]